MIHNIIHFLNATVLPLINSIGYWFYAVVLLIAFLESTIIVGTFLPGTIILFFFGFAALHGKVSLLGIVFATTSGAVIGDLISYAIGRYSGDYLQKEKGVIRLTHIEYGKKYFTRHGGKSVYFARFIGPIRQVVPLIAGVVHMPFKKFFYLDVLGGFSWAGLYVGLGYYLGTRWIFVEKIVSRIEIILTLAILVSILVYLRKKRLKQSKQVQLSESQS